MCPEEYVEYPGAVDVETDRATISGLQAVVSGYTVYRSLVLLS